MTMSNSGRRPWTPLPDGGAAFGSWSVRRLSCGLPWGLFFVERPMLHDDGTPRSFRTMEAAQRWLERNGGGDFVNGPPKARPCQYCGQMVDWGSSTPYELPEKATYHSAERCQAFLAARIDQLTRALQAIASWGAIVDDEPESRKIARDVLHGVGHAPAGYKPETSKQWGARRRRERRQREVS